MPVCRTPTSRRFFLRSPDAGSWRLLFGKERRELASSPAWLVLLVALGPLVGHAFITALESYGGESGSGGGPAGLAQGIGAFNGIVIPTFAAYGIAVALLLPFVAIRLVSSDKQSGALKLLLQARSSLGTMLAIKLIVLIGAWLLAWLPGLAALALWRSYGGHLAAPEIAAVLTGHLLGATLVGAIAIAAAALTDNWASAAVITLALTLGAWLLDFVARVRGGLALTLDAYTPVFALRTFERGELRLSLVLLTLIFTLGGLLIAWVWLPPSRTPRQRTLFTLSIVVGVGILAFGAAQLQQSWSLNEYVTSPAGEPASTYSGYPFATAARGAAVSFYLLWPALVIGLWWLSRRPRVAKTS